MIDNYGLPITPMRSGFKLEIEGIDCFARESGQGAGRRWIIRQASGRDLATARRLAHAVRIARLAIQMRRLEER